MGIIEPGPERIGADLLARIKLAGIEGERHLMIDCMYVAPRGIGVRERLPDRRGCEGFDIEALGLRFHATVSRFGDGRLAEIFIDAFKAGSAADATARDAGITASIALQMGADPRYCAMRCAEMRAGTPSARSAQSSTCLQRGKHDRRQRR